MHLGALMRILLAMILAMSFAGGAYAADCAPLRIENTVKMLPLDRANRILLPIRLNGLDMKFLFDTGGAFSAVSDTAVKALKLPEFRSNYRTSDLYGHDSETFIQVHEVVLGNATSTGVQLQVMADLGNEGSHSFDGILAAGIFLHDDIDLDFGAERLNFFSADHCEGKVVYWPHQVLSVIPVSQERSSMIVPVTLDGHALRAVLDTGAPITSMDLDRARRKLGFSPETPATGSAHRDNPGKQAYPRRFANLSLDGVLIQNPLVIVEPLRFGGGKTDDVALGS